MPAVQNTYGSIGNSIAGYYSAMLLSHAKPITVIEKYGQVKNLPKNETKVMQFRRPRPFKNATTPLREGVTPQGQQFGYDELTVVMQQYGDWSGLTDQVTDFNKNAVLSDIGMMQGEQIAATREELTWDIVRSGTGVVYGGNFTARASLDKTAVLNAGKQRQVTTALGNSKAKRLTQVLSSSEDYNTYAIEASYIAITHENLDSTIRELGVRMNSNSRSQFTPTSDYGASMKVTSQYEVGSYEKVRYICTPDHGGWFAAGATCPQGTEQETYYWDNDGKGNAAANNRFNVYPIMFLGRDCFACVPLAGNNKVRPYILNPNVARGGDPIAQRGTIGWKMYWACLRTNELWMRRLEVVASATGMNP